MPTSLRLTTLALCTGAIACLASPAPAQAQFGKLLKNAVKQKAEQTAVQKATDAKDANLALSQRRALASRTCS